LQLPGQALNVEQHFGAKGFVAAFDQADPKANLVQDQR
jgi:hypothetical protein